jgi:hypothetical protein
VQENLLLIIVNTFLFIVRILGILQRLSVCYAIVLAIHFFTKYGNPKRRILGFVSLIAIMLTYLSFMLNFENIDIGCPLS